MRKCSECNGKITKLKDKTPEGMDYQYFKCKNCKEEIINMKQLHDVAKAY